MKSAAILKSVIQSGPGPDGSISAIVARRSKPLNSSRSLWTLTVTFIALGPYNGLVAEPPDGARGTEVDDLSQRAGRSAPVTSWAASRVLNAFAIRLGSFLDDHPSGAARRDRPNAVALARLDHDDRT